jgi:hypothetical protein
MRRRMGRRGKMRSMAMYIFWPRTVVGVTLQQRSMYTTRQINMADPLTYRQFIKTDSLISQLSVETNRR